MRSLKPNPTRSVKFIGIFPQARALEVFPGPAKLIPNLLVMTRTIAISNPPLTVYAMNALLIDVTGLKNCLTMLPPRSSAL